MFSVAKSNSKDVTPGMSMIAKTGNGSAGRGRRSAFAVSDEDESSERDTDDSQQPSAKVRVQPKSRSSTLTSRTGRNISVQVTPGLGKTSLNRTPVSTSRRSSGSFSNRSTSKLIEITREEERNDACKKFVTGFGIIAVMVSFMLLVFMQYEANSLVHMSEHDGEYWNKTLKSFRDEMKVLKQEFSAQDKRSWAVISSSLRGILKEQPSQPSVLLLVSTDEKTRASSECLAMKVAHLASGVLGLVPPGKKPKDASKFLTKADLFNHINHDLAARGAFVLGRLETLPGTVAMALHGICDNLSAPQKQAVVLMLVDVGKFDAAGDNIEAVVEDVLTKKWEEQLDIDRIAPILSRITVSVVRVKEESKNPCA